VCSEELGISRGGWGSFLHEKSLSFSSVKNKNVHEKPKVRSQIANPKIWRLQKISYITGPSANVAKCGF
jgi:hypothetical protein